MDFPWINTAANSQRQIKVDNDCDGSPACVAVVHLRTESGTYPWLEAHLNEHETLAVRNALDAVLAEYKASRAPTNSPG